MEFPDQYPFSPPSLEFSCEYPLILFPTDLKRFEIFENILNTYFFLKVIGYITEY